MGMDEQGGATLSDLGPSRVEVYEITGWQRGGTTFNSRLGGRPPSRADRWEFVGILADETLRKRYVNRSVAKYFKRGMANPIAYVNL